MFMYWNFKVTPISVCWSSAWLVLTLPYDWSCHLQSPGWLRIVLEGGNLQTWKTGMVVCDTKCPFWDQVSLNNTKLKAIASFKSSAGDHFTHRVQGRKIRSLIHNEMCKIHWCVLESCKWWSAQQVSQVTFMPLFITLFHKDFSVLMKMNCSQLVCNDKKMQFTDVLESHKW